MIRPDVFFKMKEEKEKGKLTQLPLLHPSSKHEPNPNCVKCLGTGWIIYPVGHFTILGMEYKYDGHDATFCSCTFFSKETEVFWNKECQPVIKKMADELRTLGKEATK